MDDVLQAINNLIDSSAFTKSFIKEASKLETKALSELSKTEDQLNRVSSPESSQRAYELALSQTLDIAPDLTTDQMEAALAKSEEYSYLSFARPLLDVAKDRDLYELISNGTGWNRTVVVKLNMDTVAGTIDDYAAAVEETRSEAGIDPDRNPERSSMIWRTKIWPTRGGAGPYTHIVNTRIALGRSPAPFWSLLNNGNKNVHMASDIGGTPYPSSEGTHFVEESELVILRYFNQVFNQFREENRAAIEFLAHTISDYRDAIEGLRDLVAQMISNLPQAKVTSSRLRVRTLEEISPIKLQKAREMVSRGEILPGQRINIGIRGVRVRVRLSTLYPE